MHLLDSNVLIALTIVEHEHHERASRWAQDAGDLALCPVTQGALTRFLVRLGESPATAAAILAAHEASDRCVFVPDDVSYARLDLARISGHRQVTDAYLVALAAAHGARLATLHEGLAALHPDGAVLLPG